MTLHKSDGKGTKFTQKLLQCNAYQSAAYDIWYVRKKLVTTQDLTLVSRDMVGLLQQRETIV